MVGNNFCHLGTKQSIYTVIKLEVVYNLFMSDVGLVSEPDPRM